MQRVSLCSNTVPVSHWNLGFPVVEIATDIDLTATTIPAKYNWDLGLLCNNTKHTQLRVCSNTIITISFWGMKSDLFDHELVSISASFILRERVIVLSRAKKMPTLPLAIISMHKSL